MAKVVGYIGCSVDGYIVDADGNMDWLHTHGVGDYGAFDYAVFIKTIGTIVMGRATYDWVRQQVEIWPYPDQNTIVVTSSALPDAPPKTVAWSDTIEALTQHLARLPGKDVWICGGGRLQSALIDLDALDYLEIFIVPVLIGGGSRLWPGSSKTKILELDDARHLDKGIVRLAYRRKSPVVGNPT